MSCSIVLLPVVLVLGVVMSAEGFAKWLDTAAKNKTKKKRKQTSKVKTSLKNSVNTKELRSYPTNFRDSALLVKTLEDFGVDEIQQSKQELRCKVNGFPLRFYPDATGIYQVEIAEDSDLRLLYGKLASLDIEYRKNVQALTYYNLKQKAVAANMTIENEEILDDNSIVVTLSIGD